MTKNSFAIKMRTCSELKLFLVILIVIPFVYGQGRVAPGVHPNRYHHQDNPQVRNHEQNRPIYEPPKNNYQQQVPTQQPQVNPFKYLKLF
jgi:hypothetical protein